MKNGKDFFFYYFISGFFFRITSVRCKCLCEIETAILNFIALFTVSLFFYQKFISAFGESVLIWFFNGKFKCVNNICYY